MILVIVFELLIMVLTNMNKMEMKGYVTKLKIVEFENKFANCFSKVANFFLEGARGKKKYKIMCKSFNQSVVDLLFENACIELTSYFIGQQKWNEQWVYFVEVYEAQPTTILNDRRANNEVEFVTVIENEIKETPKQQVETYTQETIEMLEKELGMKEQQPQKEEFTDLDWVNFLEKQEQEYKNNPDVELGEIEVVEKQEK